MQWVPPGWEREREKDYCLMVIADCVHVCLPKSLTSTARVARVELWRIWKRRVLPVWLWPPLREVPPLWMIMGFPLKRLIKWAGSWPWVTRTCRATQRWILNRVDLFPINYALLCIILDISSKKNKSFIKYKLEMDNLSKKYLRLQLQLPHLLIAAFHVLP